MVGTSFADSTLKSLKFEEVMGSYMGISYCKMFDVQFLNCVLNESRFMDMKFQKVQFLDTDLTKSEFNMVSFNKMDLSSCKLDDILIDPKYLFGSTLSYEQLLIVANLLSIRIK